MKRFFKLLVIVLAVAALGAMALASSAEEPTIVASGSCGTNLTYTLDSEGTLTIKGTGAMSNYSSSSSVPWYNNSGSVKTVVIDSGVTSISNYAFYGCSDLTSVTIPDSVTSIGSDAFSYCTKLQYNTYGTYGGAEYLGNSSNPYVALIKATSTSISSCSISPQTKMICGYAFRDCDSLTSVTIGNSVTSIGDDAFYRCSSLTSVTIPNSVTSIGNYAFELCTSLTSVHISDIASWCGISFAGYLSNPVYYAHELYLNGEQVTDLVIPDSVTGIGDHAFYGCTSLTSVTIPDSVTSIGDSAFAGCTYLTNPFIPASVETMGRSVFNNCNSITDIYCEAKSRPIGWATTWKDGTDVTVHWGSTGSAAPAIFGDLNGDGIVNIQDVTVLLLVIAGEYDGTTDTVAAIPPKFEY